MSEYNNFLKHFNRLKNSAAGTSDREDIIPVNNTGTDTPARMGFDDFSEKIAEEKQAGELMFTESLTSEGDAPDNNIGSPADNGKNTERETENSFSEDTGEDISDNIPNTRFIKTNSTPFISVNAETDELVPTAVEKYTDRLNPRQPEKRKKTGYTGKINTYDANHSPMAGAPKFITVTEEIKKEARENTSLKQTPEKTAASQTKIIPKVIEKKENEIGEPKVILEKLPEESVSDKTKIINKKGSLLREIAKTSGSLTQEDIDQLTMDGFAGEDTDALETELLEKELSEVREKRVNDFNFWSEEKAPTGESEDKSISSSDDKALPGFLSFFHEKFGHLDTDFVPVGDEEFTDPTKRKAIFSRLISIRKGLIIKTAVTALLGIVLLLINIITSLSAAMNSGFFSVLGSSSVAYNTINIFGLVITAILMADDLKKGLFSILKLRPKTDSVLLAVFAGALIQNIASYFTLAKTESDFHLLTSAAILMCVPVLISKIFYCDSTRHAFKAAAATSDKSYLRTVSDENIRASLLKERSETETNVVYTGKTRFISDFLKKCAGGAFSAQSSSKAVALTMLSGIIAFIVAIITSGSVTYALGCFTMCMALSFPVSSLVFTGYMLAQENSALSVKSSFISSFSDAHSFCNIDDIVLTGSDIFSAEITDVTCSKNVARKQAEFCAAVLTSCNDGILKKAFAPLGEGLEDRFPEAEGFKYEDKLGLSAWISDCKVLLGTKDYLVNHNVQLPDENSVPFMLGENIKPLFLAIEGHFAAVFSVKYTCNALAARSLAELTSNGANILIGIRDPNITEEFAEKLLSLPENSLRIIKNDVYESFSAQTNTVTDSENTGIVFTDSFDSFCRTMAGAIRLEKIKKVSKTLCEAGSLAGAVFALILTFTSAAGTINSWIAVILQMLWIMAGFIITPMIVNVPLKAQNDFAKNIVSGVKAAASAERKPRQSERRAPSAKSLDEDIAGIFTDGEEKTEASENTDAPVKKAEKQPTKVAEKKIVAPPVFSEHSKPQFRDPAEQLIMEGAPYTKPPEVIDFNKITGNEEYTSDEPEKQTVSDDLLDSYAQQTPSERTRKKSSPAPRSKKQGILSKLVSSAQDYSDEESIFEDAPARSPRKKSIASFIDEKIPAPPRFEKEKKKEKDPLDEKFVPPETDIASTVYKDDYFASFDTDEDDKTFSDIRKKRRQEEEDSDFWSSF